MYCMDYRIVGHGDLWKRQSFFGGWSKFSLKYTKMAVKLSDYIKCSCIEHFK